MKDNLFDENNETIYKSVIYMACENDNMFMKQIEEQEEALNKKLSKYKNWRITKKYSEIYKKGTQLYERPVFSQLISDIKYGKIKERIFIAGENILGDNSKEIEVFIDFLNKCEISLFHLDCIALNEPKGLLFLKQSLSFSNYNKKFYEIYFLFTKNDIIKAESIWQFL